MKKVFLCLLLVLPLIVIACQKQSNDDNSNGDFIQGNPSPQEILSKDKDADIFSTLEVVYRNAEDDKSIKELELTLGKEYFEITKQTNNPDEFGSGSATKLPVGTKIYNTSHPQVLIAVVDGKEIRYFGLIEG
ncbi:hypothetical protein [Ornithinibacillus californiensis]|uniref:hypothetical protein n=1 Tax=Ornithinibacillus californiensis TaxID=161536 RepID=UPI00069F51E9|nr:hypothetical protein [Ornithinibacillus californiensis]